MPAHFCVSLDIVKYRYHGCGAPCWGIILRVGCSVCVLACASERFGHCGKSPSSS